MTGSIYSAYYFEGENDALNATARDPDDRHNTMDFKFKFVGDELEFYAKGIGGRWPETQPPGDGEETDPNSSYMGSGGED